MGAFESEARQRLVLADIDTLGPQLLSRLLDLGHQLGVRLGHVIERVHAPAELEEEVCAKGNEGPEGQLQRRALAHHRMA